MVFPRKDDFKKTFRGGSHTERRVKDALQRQKNARRDMASNARQLVFGGGSTPEAQPTSQGGIEVALLENEHSRKNDRGERIESRKAYFSKQFMCPEWMLEVPSDLNGKGGDHGEGWFVLPRPEGKRCIVISASGGTVSRLQDGGILHSFASALPSGGMSGGGSSDGYSILDCIYHEQDNTYYILDLMCWKGYLLYDCTAEFRLFWKQSKLQDLLPLLGAGPPHCAHRFQLLPCLEADVEGITAAHSAPAPFVRDGLLFMNKQGHYDLGVTPLVQLWKDEQCARYLHTASQQNVVLRVNAPAAAAAAAPVPAAAPASVPPPPPAAAAHLVTEDGLAVVGGQLPPDLAQQFGQHGTLLRFSITSAQAVTAPAVGAGEGEGGVLTLQLFGLQFDKKCSPRKTMADSLSKIIFQSRLREGSALALQTVLSVAASPNGGGAVVGVSDNGGASGAREVEMV